MLARLAFCSHPRCRLSTPQFAFDEVLRLWEALWTGLPTRQLHLYLCVAALAHQRRRIMSDPSHDFDSILKLCIDLAGHLRLDVLLRDAETLANFAGAAGAAAVAGLP